MELLRTLAEELVRLRVELIVTSGTAATLAAKSATYTIPIVFWSSGDPVRAGLVASLARPGGNVTGYSIAISDMTRCAPIVVAASMMVTAVSSPGTSGNPGNLLNARIVAAIMPIDL